METTKEIRSMDMLGRLVIPRQLCSQLQIAPGTAVELLAQDDAVIIRKYAGAPVAVGVENQEKTAGDCWIVKDCVENKRHLL